MIFLVCMMCTISLLGETHLMFHTLPIDGNLKTAMKEVKKWGFMGMKIKNMGVLIGSLDNEDVIVTLIATPQTNTLFSVAVAYEGTEKWEDALAKYHALNTQLATQYGAPTEVINQWEAPYSLDNQPALGIRENKGKYGTAYTTEQGNVIINIMYMDGKLCPIVTYVDQQNGLLFKSEGGESDLQWDDNAEGVEI